jgi:hypothetical protein
MVAEHRPPPLEPDVSAAMLELADKENSPG